jgi:PAS domain-containing protein
VDHEVDRVAPDQDWHTVGVLDAAGRFEWVSGVAAFDLGMEAQQLVGRWFAELLPTDDRARFNLLLSEMVGREGSGRHVLACLTGCDGPSASRATRQWRLTGLRAASGRFGVALEVRSLDSGQPPALHRDRSDDVLQRKSAELEATLRALPDLFFRFDCDGHFLDWPIS